jgi:hypothetical protein
VLRFFLPPAGCYLTVRCLPITWDQVLRYEKGQHYGVHHDYGAEDVKLSCGPRILTFFLYLSGMSLFIWAI